MGSRPVARLPRPRIDAGVYRRQCRRRQHPALVAAIREQAGWSGPAPRIAHVLGDDLDGDANTLGSAGRWAPTPISAFFGIARALSAGADIVVTGRVTDAALTIGPGIAHFGWAARDYDALAGATVAGHVIEVGTQATGGNHPSSPRSPIRSTPASPSRSFTATAPASSPSTQAPVAPSPRGHGHLAAALRDRRRPVCRARRHHPARLRARHPGRRRPSRHQRSPGRAPPPDLKVSLTTLGGYRNELTLVLTGLDIDAKAAPSKGNSTGALPQVRPN